MSCINIYELILYLIRQMLSCFHHIWMVWNGTVSDICKSLFIKVKQYHLSASDCEFTLSYIQVLVWSPSDISSYRDMTPQQHLTQQPVHMKCSKLRSKYFTLYSWISMWGIGSNLRKCFQNKSGLVISSESLSPHCLVSMGRTRQHEMSPQQQRTRAPIQYKDGALPVEEIPLWR